MLGDNVHAHVKQAFGRLFFIIRAVPCAGPHHADPGVGIDGTRAESKGVDAADHFGNGKGRHIADFVLPGHGTGHHAGKITGLVHAAEIGGHVFMRLVAGTVHEGRLRELSGHFFHGIHIAETGSHDHIVSLAGHVQKGPFGIRTFRNGFHKGGFHSGHGVYGLAALIMGIGPAFVSHRRNIDKTNLERFVFPGFESLSTLGAVAKSSHICSSTFLF